MYTFYIKKKYIFIQKLYFFYMKGIKINVHFNRKRNDYFALKYTFYVDIHMINISKKVRSTFWLVDKGM